MSEITIPDEALKAAYAVKGYGTITREKMRELLAAAAPLIVAAHYSMTRTGAAAAASPTLEMQRDQYARRPRPHRGGARRVAGHRDTRGR
jgi:hypothetical protein